MQAVSQAWKDLQRESLLPESFVEVKLMISEPGLNADGSITDNGHSSSSHTDEVVGGLSVMPNKYATLEHNIWTLDRSVDTMPDAEPRGTMGYISGVYSGADGTFDTPPTLTISFSHVWSALIPGISIDWGTAYGEWASSYRVTAYNGSTQIAQQTVTGNTAPSSTLWMDLQNFDRVTVEVLSWCLPGRRARVASILVGINRTYGKTDLLGYTHNESVSPLSAELPKAEISFSVSNLDGEYNPDNTDGIAKYLTERQMVSVRYGYKLTPAKTEWINGGVYYLSEWETPQNGIKTSFTARDALEYLTDKYTGTKSGTLMDIATAALTQSTLPVSDTGVRWVIDESLSRINARELDADAEYTTGEILQLCANASCCVFYQDREGILRIEPLADGVSDYVVDPFISYSYADLTLSKQLKTVDINNGQYVLTVGAVGETQSISNPLLTDAQAEAVARWVAGYLTRRKVLSGSYRADPRLMPLDRITNVNKYATNTVLVTDVAFTYNGAFRGTYEGRADA